jgi:hypothetical protein
MRISEVLPSSEKRWKARRRKGLGISSGRNLRGKGKDGGK